MVFNNEALPFLGNTDLEKSSKTPAYSKNKWRGLFANLINLPSRSYICLEYGGIFARFLLAAQELYNTFLHIKISFTTAYT